MLVGKARDYDGEIENGGFDVYGIRHQHNFLPSAIFGGPRFWVGRWYERRRILSLSGRKELAVDV